MDQNRDSRDVPVMVRRRRRTQREQTPDPAQRTSTGDEHDIGRGNVKYTDEETSSQTSDHTAEYRRTKAGTVVKVKASTGTTMDGHRSKILGKRDKAIGTSSHRSQSQPKIAPAELVAKPVKEVLSDSVGTSDMMTLIKQATRRSQSTPRKREESDDSGRVSPMYEQVRRRINERPVNPVPTASQTASNREAAQLELNMKRFDEERRKFEMEKLRFLEEKRQLDKIRLLRFEKYRQGAFGDHPAPPKVEPIKAERARLDNLVIVAKSTPEPSPGPLATAKRVSSLKERKRRSRTRRDEDESSPIESSSEEVERVRHRARNILQPKEPKPKIVEKLPDMNVTEVKVEPEKIIEPAKDEKPTEIEEKVEEKATETKEVAEKTVEAPKPEAEKTKDTPAPVEDETPKPSFLTRLFGIFRQEPKVGTEDAKPPEGEKKEKEPTMVEKPEVEEQLTKFKILKLIYRDVRDNWAPFKAQHQTAVLEIKQSARKCFVDMVLLCIMCGIGGMVFKALEGNYENSYKCGVRKVKRDFIDQLWLSSHNMREEDWKSLARTRLRKFEEELQVAFEAAGQSGYTGHTVWNFVNGVLYCWTVITTIGYGHITPATTTGKIVTIIYAIIGIPLFLILLADFGRLFTRGIKFVWAYVRRLYYTGSCRKVRKTSQVQDVMRGVNQVMDIVRRPSQAVTNFMSPENGEVENGVQPPPITPQSGPPDTPQTEMSELVIDDEFNLPISLAIFILLTYMIVGALVYFSWESSWSLFESFYFVFISMSTIGFGDYVPEHPMYMMCSIVYLIFGLALTSMCINVVQMKLSDSFRMASAKIGQTIGLQLAQQSQQGTPMPPDAMSIGGGGAAEGGDQEKVDMGDGAPPLPSKASLSSRNSSPQRPPKRPDLLTPESERKAKGQK